MESFKIENLTFTYPDRNTPALSDISITVSKGEFLTVCGLSGCGKTTLLRLLKPTLSPFGVKDGNISFDGRPVTELNVKEQASRIGFIMQSPDNQIVTDKVWHELAFGLESLGCKTPEIRTRVSEMASFFGIQTWFHKKVTELSGGQKQLLNLASVMAMQPDVLILDEPTSRLDPIAAQDFIKTLRKINLELGTTVILTEHRLEDAFTNSDRIIVMDCGRIIADAVPQKIGKILKELEHPMYTALPAPMRIYGEVENKSDYPISVCEGKKWLEHYSSGHKINTAIRTKNRKTLSETVIEIKDVWFRYGKELPDVIKGLNAKIHKGEIFAILGGNGTGKTTALSLISGLNKPYRGEILINGKSTDNIKNLYSGVLGVLPQNPQSLFVKKTVYLELLDMLTNIPKHERDEQLKSISILCGIEDLLDFHPYDLSGGEQQRAALAKILLQHPQILLLDEPTKGMDSYFKEKFADILINMKLKGVTFITVSHDIEFCAKYADRCAMFFDGTITSTNYPREFFAGKSFYTTAANRMARNIIPDAVLAEDIMIACGAEIKKTEEKNIADILFIPAKEQKEKQKTAPKKISAQRIVSGCIFAVLFLLTSILGKNWNTHVFQFTAITEVILSIICFFPQREFGIKVIQQPSPNRNLAKRTMVAALLILIAIPLTIYIGVYYLGGRKYYFISLLIILETLIPFVMVFEHRKPQARELIIISVMCAIAVAGRTAFFMLPQFKPVVALVIIAGICFGGETGFLVGVISGFVSNFFFGQGPWAPWQMFAFGIIGFIAGLMFRKGFIRKTKMSLAVFGAVSTFFIYGGIIDPASVIMWQANPTAEMIASAYITGIPFNLIHAASTAFFLWFISEPMIEKLERIKVKYNLIE